MPSNNVDKPLNEYSLPVDADPNAPEADFDLPEEYDPELMKQMDSFVESLEHIETSN